MHDVRHRGRGPSTAACAVTPDLDDARRRADRRRGALAPRRRRAGRGRARRTSAARTGRGRPRAARRRRRRRARRRSRCGGSRSSTGSTRARRCSPRSRRGSTRARLDGADIEAVNAALIACKDALWAIGHDRIGTARAVEDLVGGAPSGPAALAAFHSIAGRAVGDRPARGARPRLGRAARARDRPRARPRRPDDRPARRRARTPTRCSPPARCARPTGISASCTRPRPRSASSATTRRACAPRSATTSCCGSRCAPTAAEASVLAHTRWASIGIISEANAHPLNAARSPTATAVRRTSRPRSTATSTTTPISKALDGLQLPGRDHDRRQGDPRARRAPARTRRRSRRGVPLDRRLVRGFGRDRRAVARPIPTACCSRSAAAARRCTSASRRGRFVVASEPYGLVAECGPYVRLDGETMLDPGNPASQGQVVVLDRTLGGHARRHPPAVVRRPRASGRPRPTSARPRSRRATSTAATRRTTSYKEITEAPASFRKTLRGKIVERDGQLDVQPAAPRRCRPTWSRALRAGDDPARARHRAGHRGDRGPEPGARAARRDRGPRRRDRGGRARPSCPGSGSGPT